MTRTYVDMDAVRYALGEISKNGFYKMRKRGAFPPHDKIGPSQRKLWSMASLESSDLPACELVVRKLAKSGDAGGGDE